MLTNPIISCENIVEDLDSAYRNVVSLFSLIWLVQNIFLFEAVFETEAFAKVCCYLSSSPPLVAGMEAVFLTTVLHSDGEVSFSLGKKSILTSSMMALDGDNKLIFSKVISHVASARESGEL